MTDLAQALTQVFVGASGVIALVIALLGRRKMKAEANKADADAEFSYGGAWEKFVQNQEKALAKAETRSEQLAGKLNAAEHRLLVLERQRNEALFWQAQITSREQIVSAILSSRGIDVPPMPPPPVVREPYTRQADFEGEVPGDGGIDRRGAGPG